MSRARLAANVYAFRKLNGLTQSKLAEITHINVTHIGYIENERISTGIDNIVKLAAALQTDPCVLLARPMIKLHHTGIRAQHIIPTFFKEGVAAYAFWTDEGMEYHEIAKGHVQNALAMMALMQANGICGKDLLTKSKKLHIPYKTII